MSNLFMLLIFTVNAMRCPGAKSYQVALTFDDGPHSVNTKKVLNILKAKEAPSTFFINGVHLTGSQNKNNFKLLDQMLEEGHSIGSHTHKHIHHTQIPYNEAKFNINKASETFGDYITSILRLPYGDGASLRDDLDGANTQKPVVKLINSLGYRHIGWDIDTRDWSPSGRQKLPGKMLRDICNTKGGVILFHDVQPNTVSNIADWIDKIRAAGHTIVKLGDLKNSSGNTRYPEANRCYKKNPESKCNRYKKTQKASSSELQGYDEFEYEVEL